MTGPAHSRSSASDATNRELLLHTGPAAVGAWCREHARAGTVFVAPSASARRLVLQHVADTKGTSLGLNVSSRGRFLSLLESRAGLSAPGQLSQAIERILISDAARALHLPLFDDQRHDAPAGAVNAVASLIRTLRLNRITPDQLRDAGGDARAADAYARFETTRARLGLHDEIDRIDALLAAGVPSLALVIQEPSIPHRAAWDLLSAALDASSSCHLGLSMLSTDRTAPAWTTKLASLGFTTFSSQHSAAAPSTRAIGGIGAQDEVELVAREILALLRSPTSVRDDTTNLERPIRPCDVLGVAPNADYLTLLADACSRLGIPVASPRFRATADVPLVRALLETFRLLADPDEDTTERGLALLAAPYVGLSQDRHDRLSRALLLRNLGQLRSWHRFAESTRSKKFTALAGSVAALANRLQGERAPKELAAALSSLGFEFGFLSSGRRFNLVAGRDDALRIDQQGWESLVGAADELNEALRVTGTMRISARRWLSELTQLLATSSVRVDAKAYEGVHLAIAGAGLPSVPHVFAVGWREGLFPRRTREDPLLPERVKKALNEMGAMIPLIADKTESENERREWIRCAARDTLTISWPSTGDDGDQLLPSFYMDDIGVTDRSARAVGETTWPLPLAASRRERLARATMVARHRTVADAGAELSWVRATLSSMSATERRAYDGLLHAGQVIQLPTEILDEIAPLARDVSATQLRMVVHCLYEHFGKRRLGLGTLAAPQLDPLMLGKITHGTLNDVGRGGFDPTSVAPVFDQWWNELVPRELRDDAQVTFEQMILLSDLTQLVEREHEHFAVSGSTPTYFELSFGTNDNGRDPASLAHGLEVALLLGTMLSRSTLRGAIDRVDVIERNGQRYGVAIDYKSGKGDRYLKEMDEMADFQLPIYCEVLPSFGIEPVGAMYLGIASGERYGVVRSDFVDTFVPAGSKGVRSLSPEEFDVFMRDRQHVLRTEIARLARGELQTKPRNDDCGYCDLRPVCRIGTFGVGGVHVTDE